MQTKIKDLFLFNSGIYCIKNKINNKVYVGSSINITKRKSLHFKSLEQNKHHSIKLQRAYEKYGKENFEHFILEYCDKKDLDVLEKEWIVYFDSYHNGYNSTDEVGAPWRGKKQPEEVKKLQKCIAVKIIDPNGNVIEDYSISNFSKKYKLSMWCISNVLSGKFSHYKGWRKYSKALEGVKFSYADFYKNTGKNKAKSKYDFVNPDGVLVHINNLSGFSKENFLDSAAMHRVACGKNFTCWGWRLANEKTIGVKYIPKLLRKKYVG